MLFNQKKLLFFWVSYLVLLWCFAITQGGKADFLVFAFKNVLVISFFYINILFVLPILFIRKKLLLFILVCLLCLLAYLALRYFMTNNLLPLLGKGNFKDVFGKVYLSNQIYIYIHYIIYALFFWYSRKLILTEKNLRKTESERFALKNHTLKLESENLNLQNAKLIAEYNHLKAQINPHFLFNTLNTFYSDTEPVLPETAKGIMLLSDIMRYSLESGGADGKVPLREELAQLNNYIELMQLRFDQQLKIEGNLIHNNRIQWPRDMQKWRILPHLLITIAENAFKHGNNREPFIIDLNLENNQLRFTFRNTIGMRKVETGTGIGLKNMLDRLGFTYGSNGRLETAITGSTFITELYITDNASLTAENLNLAS